MGTRAPAERPDRDDRETDGDVSPAAVKALVDRVDSLEDRVRSQQETITDLVAMVNALQDDVEEGSK